MEILSLLDGTYKLVIQIDKTGSCCKNSTQKSQLTFFIISPGGYYTFFMNTQSYTDIFVGFQ